MVRGQQDEAHEVEETHEIGSVGALFVEVDNHSFGSNVFLGEFEQANESLLRLLDGSIDDVDIQLFSQKSAIPLGGLVVPEHIDLDGDADGFVVRQLAQLAQAGWAIVGTKLVELGRDFLLISLVG